MPGTDEQTLGSITAAFERLRQGDAASIRPLWERYLPRLLALARKTLAGRPQRAADAEDVVQAAFLSFWNYVQKGAVTGDVDRERLWRLLATMTVKKALKQSAHEAAQKRGAGKVVTAGDWDVTADGLLPADARSQLSALSVQEFDVLVDELLGRLNDELRAFAVLKLAGYSNAEIGDLFDCSERTAQRKLQLVRMNWEAELK